MMSALRLGLGPFQVKRRGDDADDVGPLPVGWPRRRRSAGVMMLMMSALPPGLGPFQVKRKGDDADDVGPLPADWDDVSPPPGAGPVPSETQGR